MFMNRLVTNIKGFTHTHLLSIHQLTTKYDIPCGEVVLFVMSAPVNSSNSAAVAAVAFHRPDSSQLGGIQNNLLSAAAASHLEQGPEASLREMHKSSIYSKSSI